MLTPLRILVIAASLAPGSPVRAQTITLPATAANREGDATNSFPWGRGTTGLRLQCIYDAANFTAQGIAAPIVVERLRWRPDAATARSWSACAYDPATILLSTCPRDHASASTRFADNEGADLMTVFQGRIAYAAGASQVPGPANPVIDVGLTVPFVYDPALGDLTVEIDLPVGSFSGIAGFQCDVQSAGAQAARVYASSSYGAPSGTVQTDHGVVIEVVARPATGLLAAFTATPRNGPSPLTVAFRDRSFSSDPGGVRSWAWDFDDDGTIDSTDQNPTFVFGGCGDHAVSLSVTDAVHGRVTRRVPAYVATDAEVDADFTWSVLAPGIVMFQDTTQPPATAWEWDLDGDGVVDSNAQTPVFVYGSACASTEVTLRSRRHCRGPFQRTRTVLLAPNTQATTFAGGNGSGSGSAIGTFFDVDVTNPLGVRVCAITVAPYAFIGAFQLEAFVCSGSYVGRDGDATRWRLAGRGTAGAAGGSPFSLAPVVVPLERPMYLPRGAFGVAIYLSRASGSTNVAYSNGVMGPFSGPDLTVAPSPASAPGLVRTGPFGGGVLSPRVWNGAFHYSTSQVEAEAGFGTFATGCAGTEPASRLLPLALPQIGGRMELEIDHLPQSAAIMLFGFGRDVSALGSLPLGLGPIGAPGCQLHIEPVAAHFVLGAVGVARWSFAVPPNVAVLRLPFYDQAIVLDARSNPLGAVMSDAGAGVVGQ